jgi:hypothetical protein
MAQNYSRVGIALKDPSLGQSGHLSLRTTKIYERRLACQKEP